MNRILGVALVSLLALAGCSKKDEPAPARDSYVYEPVRAASAAIAVVSKPDATRALFLGDEAKRLVPYFERLGVRPMARAEGRVDILVIACGEMSRESLARAAGLVSANGIVVWLMDLEKVTMGRFKAMLESFALEGATLWMPGESRWVAVGRKVPRRIKLSATLEVFNRERAFADLLSGGCGSLGELFANYAGTLEDVMPAFAASPDAGALVRPEYFLTKEIPSASWLAAEDTDGDIAKSVADDIRSMQVVRRLVIEGGLRSQAAKDRKDEEAAIDCWSRAIKRNPGELFVRERLDRLERNARGFLSCGKVLQAMKCYETMVLVKPTAASVNNFGQCLKKIGKLDLAEQVLRRAKELEK